MSASIESSARLLIVDDEPASIHVLQRLLERDGYANVRSTVDSGAALRLFADAKPDLVVLDLNMPSPDGFVLLEEIGRRTAPDEYLPILVLTGDAGDEQKHRALLLGAADFLTKPFDSLEVACRIRTLLKTRFLHLGLQEQRRILEDQVAARTRELEEAHLEILERLAHAAEFRDDDTGQHTRRVGELAARIAVELGLPERSAELIRRAAPLHDVGKIGIPDAVLLKPGPLAPEEFAVIKKHTTIGAQVLGAGRSPAMALAEEIALSHHERWDGAGYPRSLRGTEIPLSARIVAVADFYDALSHARPYREAWPVDRVMDEIEKGSGSHFDPAVVQAFRRVQARLPGSPPASPDCPSDPPHADVV